MRRTLSLTSICFVLSLGVGCQSAEERCNAAKVTAHDAWEAYAVEAEQNHARAAQIPGLSLLERLGASGTSPQPIRRVGALARGGAIAFRDAVRAFRRSERINDEDLSTAATAAFRDADLHWDACQAVEP